MSDLCIVHCTTGSRENAETIATQLIEQRLAACVQIIPGVTSVYRWQEQIMQDQEWLLLIKTHAEHLHAAEALVQRIHSYDIPEWVVVRGNSASQAYSAWVNQELNIEKRK